MDDAPLPVTLVLPDRLDAAPLDPERPREDVRTSRRLEGLLRVEADALVLAYRPVAVVERRVWTLNPWNGGQRPEVREARTEVGTTAELRIAHGAVATCELRARGWRRRPILRLALRDLVALDGLPEFGAAPLEFALAPEARAAARALCAHAQLRLADAQLERLRAADVPPLPPPAARRHPVRD